MRPLLASLACVALIACTPDGPGKDAVVSQESPSPLITDTPAPTTTAETTEVCTGLGRVPRSGQITLVEDNELRAFSSKTGSKECLLNLEELGLGYGLITPPSWNASGARVIVDDRAVSRDLTVTPRLTKRNREVAQWSRPKGDSVVWVTAGGELLKRSSVGGKATNISFLVHHDAVTYHPAGLHIASSGRAEDGSYGLYLTTNLGTEPQLIARGEEANLITDLTFSQDGQWLYFTARHGKTDWHLHRMSMGAEASLETIARTEIHIDYAVSPFDSNLYAWFEWGDCSLGETGSFHVSDTRFKIPAGLQLGRIDPVGWLPQGKLVVRAGMGGCGTASAGEVQVLSQDDPVLIHQENYGNVSVRVAHPPPPPPPGEEQEVVA